MSAEWDDLPQEVKAELTREGYGPEQTADTGLEERIQELKAQARHLSDQIAASMAMPLDHAAFTGADNPHQGLPDVAHGEVLAVDGAHHGDTPERGEGPSVPDLPHSANENHSQTTPVQRRDAWLTLHRLMVSNAETWLRSARAFLPYAVAPSVQTEKLADEWAALQLLKALRDMKAPEVPVDDTLNQPTLEEALGPLTGRVCTDPECTIPRKPGRPMHGPHDFRAR